MSQVENGIRINKYLSEIGFCSRREADRLIEQGRIRINGVVSPMGQKVLGDEKIEVNGKQVTTSKIKNIYLAFNKPRGIVCTTDQKREKNNIIDFINYPSRVFPIGRLDKMSEGLIFLTNDGDIVNKILRAKNNHEKEYIVEVNKPITEEFTKLMSSGVPVLDTVTKKCSVKKTGKKTFKIILTQGLNRQIRRMCEYFGYKVTQLQRIRIMNISLDIPVGEYRDFTATELNQINQSVKHSIKTFEENK
ncbi:MAG: 23S rRNA pseudouridine(2604) synthase RluF [Flavobacteriales bacterium]|jgi:23S rRNA pseudouridine2604 synthase|nr:23S rRNA pseudouridine(2604) synthase RluF [Flavobacteriales bacterium]|tara:strand:+ start:19070 stop:19813 length:744 start_codon:yes stop_codon:yes gene_type:complete